MVIKSRAHQKNALYHLTNSAQDQAQNIEILHSEPGNNNTRVLSLIMENAIASGGRIKNQNLLILYMAARFHLEKVPVIIKTAKVTSDNLLLSEGKTGRIHL